MGDDDGDEVRGVGVSEALLEFDELELVMEVIDAAMDCSREEEVEDCEEEGEEEEEEWKRGRGIEIFGRAVLKRHGRRADDVGRMGLLCRSLPTMVWAMVAELPFLAHSNGTCPRRQGARNWCV